MRRNGNMAKEGRTKTQSHEFQDAVAYATIPRESGVYRKSDPAYDRQRYPTTRFARERGVRIRRTICDVLENCPPDFFSRPGIEQLVSMAGRPNRNRRSGTFTPNTVLVYRLSDFSAPAPEIAVLLNHFRQSQVRVFEVSTKQELNQPGGWVDNQLGQGRPGTLDTIQRRLADLKVRASRRRSGKKAGRKPYGTLPGERETLTRIWLLRRKPRNGPRRSYRQVAEILNDCGLRTRYGRYWEAKTIQGIVRRTRPRLA